MGIELEVCYLIKKEFFSFRKFLFAQSIRRSRARVALFTFIIFAYFSVFQLFLIFLSLWTFNKFWMWTKKKNEDLCQEAFKYVNYWTNDEPDIYFNRFATKWLNIVKKCVSVSKRLKMSQNVLKYVEQELSKTTII